MSISRLLVVSAVAAMMLTVAVPVTAQDAPRVEVSAGYNFLHIDIDEDEDPEELANLPVGWYADVAGNITSTIGVVGQITGNYKTLDIGFGEEADLSIHTFMGGIRAGGGASDVRPFGQVLFGVANSRFSSDEFDIDESENDTALQLGAGVNLMSGGVGLRLGADYIRVFGEDQGTNVFRFGVGVVFGR
jgi:hypothetical protein